MFDVSQAFGFYFQISIQTGFFLVKLFLKSVYDYHFYHKWNCFHLSATFVIRGDLSLELQMLHMFPFSLDCKTVTGLNSWTAKGDLLSIIMTICGQGVVVVAVAVSGWRGGCGFPIMVTRDGSDWV